MVFAADDFAAWLVGLLADAGRKKLTSMILGDDQERALRSAAAAAVQRTADEMRPGDELRAGQLAMVVSEVFTTPGSVASLAGDTTVLEALRAGIAGQLAVLDDASRTGTGQSSADVLEVSAGLLATKLTDHLLREIIIRGAGGGPLFPLASQLNDDATHLQGQRIETVLGQLSSEVRQALVRLDATYSLAMTSGTMEQVSAATTAIAGGDEAAALAAPSSKPPATLPAQITKRSVPVGDGLSSGTLLAIEVQPYREL